MSRLSFQERMPFNHCWGCGADNPAGLHLRSRWDAGSQAAIARWKPRPEFAAGPVHVLNGGIIATVIDCHGICTAVADAYREEGREIGEGEPIWFVTGRLEVEYLKPTPIDSELELRAVVESREPRKRWVAVTLAAGGVERARAGACLQYASRPIGWRR